MYRDVYDEVVELGREVRRRDRLRQRRATAKSQLSQRRDELQEAQRVDAKEARDVEKLEGASLTRVLLSVVGRAESRLDKERAEAVAAQLRLEQARAEVELAEAEVKRLDAQLQPLADVDTRYDAAFVDKATRLLAEDSDSAPRIRALVEEVSAAADLLREVDEALSAGTWAGRFLGQARKDIQALEDEEAAVNTAIYTTLFMSMSTGMPLAHRIEENLKQAQVWIGRYAAELRDLPGWERSASAMASHGQLLSHYVALVAGRSSSPGRRAREAIEAAERQVTHTQSALKSARPEVAQRHADARSRYRTAVENA